MMPEVGKRYRARGFEFRVDFIHDGQIYVMRWPERLMRTETARAIRMPMSVWNEQMKDAVEVS